MCCCVAPAGNKFSNTFSCLFLKEIHVFVLFNCSLYLCNCILGGGGARMSNCIYAKLLLFRHEGAEGRGDMASPNL